MEGICPGWDAAAFANWCDRFGLVGRKPVKDFSRGMRMKLNLAAALAHARLAGVVYGAADRLAGAVSSCTELLDAPFLNHRAWHMGGVCSAACAGVLRDFFAARRGPGGGSARHGEEEGGDA